MSPSAVSLLAALAALGGLAACGSAAVREAADAPAPSSVQVIGAQEVAAIGATNAEDLVRRRRPHLLLPRALHGQPAREGTPLVYVDDVRAGGIQVLPLISARNILDVHYLTWTEAEARYVGRHPAGIILIRTRRARLP